MGEYWGMLNRSEVIAWEGLLEDSLPYAAKWMIASGVGMGLEASRGLE